jgi:hypothetical protein
LVPGTTYIYKSTAVDDSTGEVTNERIVVEVLPDTRTILGVEVRVVRDRVFEEGILIEDTFDWYAQDNNGNVWYFGEDVTNYEYDDEGNLIGTDKHGSWEAGVDGSHAGIIMEARPRVGHRYFQEFSPNNVMDWGEGLAKNETARVPLGSFTNVFRTVESSVMEPDSLANKLYAPGVGTIAEFDLDIEDDEIIQTTRLISLTLNGTPVTQVVPTDGFEGVNVGGRFIGGAEFEAATRIRTNGAVIVNGAEFAAKVSIRTKAEVIVIDSVFSGNAWIRTDDTLSLKELFAVGKIRVGGKIDDAYIVDSDLHRLDLRFGQGDNELVVKDSAFTELRAYGGAGDNVFESLGDNLYWTLQLNSFVGSHAGGRP